MPTYTAAGKLLGRPYVNDDQVRMPARVLKLPAEQHAWLGRGNTHPKRRPRSERLREIMVAALQCPVIPPDPGPGKNKRTSFTLPQDLIDELMQYMGTDQITVAIRRAIRADMAGLLEGTH